MNDQPSITTASTATGATAPGTVATAARVRAKVPLNALNYLNVLAFIVANIETGPISICFDWFSPGEINRYKTLLTPIYFTSLIIVDVIILFQGIFAAM